MTGEELDFRLLFEESPDVLLVLLPDAPTYTTVGATRARLLATHTTREETVGRGLFALFPDNPEDPGATGARNLRASLDRVLSTRAPDTMAVQKYEIRGPDGTFQAKYFSPRNLPVLSPSGEVKYILHRVEDVTELVRASEVSEELRDRTRAMEREVTARSRELDAFSYSVSHDLRAPLRAIQGFSQVIATDYSKLFDDDGRDYLERILAAAGKMTTMIDTLLELSRISRAAMKSSSVDLSALARDVVADLRSADPARAVTVEIADNLVARGDAPLVRVALINLIGNAWKYTSRTEAPRIEIGCSPADEPVFFVRDNGAGFDVKRAVKLFAPFQRFHNPTEYEGTGIGLATVQRVIARHGGRVWAEAAVGAGATFFFSLPDAGPGGKRM